MYEIITKETVAPNIIYMKFKAPKIASTARPGQFVIIRVDNFRVLMVAGGKGTRSSNPSVPKILQEVAPGVTIFEIHLQNFERAGLKRITLLLGFGSEQVILEAKKLQNKFPQMSLEWQVESSQQGTFLPVRNALQSLHESHYIVVLGDIAIRADFKDLILRWKASSVEMAVTVHPNPSVTLTP